MAEIQNNSVIITISQGNFIANISITVLSLLVNMVYLILLSQMNKHPFGSQLKSGSERLLRYLAIGDFLRATACLIGLVQNYIYIHVLNQHPQACDTHLLCQVQAFLLIEANVATSCWILVVGVYYYSRIFNFTESLDSTNSSRWYLCCHILCWGIPGVIGLTAAANGGLGGDKNFLTTAGWCWIRTCNKEDDERILFWTLTGRIEEMGASFLCLLIWMNFKYYLFRKDRQMRILHQFNQIDFLKTQQSHEHKFKEKLRSIRASSLTPSRRQGLLNASFSRNYGSLSIGSSIVSNSSSSGGSVTPTLPHQNLAFEQAAPNAAELEAQQEARELCRQTGHKFYESLTTLKERNFFAVLIFFFYLSRLPGFVRYVCAIILTKGVYHEWVHNVSYGTLYAQGVCENMGILFNLFALMYYCEQARDLLLGTLVQVGMLFRNNTNNQTASS